MAQIKNSSKNNKPSDEERHRRRVHVMLIMVANVIMVVSSLLVHFDTIKLFPSSMDAGMLKTFAEKAEYAFRYQSLLVFWLVLNVALTIGGRIRNGAFNPLDKTSEEKIQMDKFILTNSFEQITTAVFAQLAFVSFASPEATLKFIPLINVFQFIGRVAFYIGYPLKRGFGFSLTSMPNVFLALYVLSKLVGFQLGL